MKTKSLSRSLLFPLLMVAALGLTGGCPAFAAEKEPRLAELDGFWAEVSRAVREGDFEGYQRTCHAEGVLVSGSSQKSYPLSKALERWRQGFSDTKSGKVKAGVEFRFSQRLGDESTAHETGIFRYFTVNPEGETKEDYIHFEVLLVKKNTWQTMMEYQKSKATKAEWDAIK